MCGIIFFTLTTSLRLVQGVPNAERTVSTGLLWLTYAIGVGIGLEVQRRRMTHRQ